jgi:hypothetical protein
MIELAFWAAHPEWSRGFQSPAGKPEYRQLRQARIIHKKKESWGDRGSRRRDGKFEGTRIMAKRLASAALKCRGALQGGTRTRGVPR